MRVKKYRIYLLCAAAIAATAGVVISCKQQTDKNGKVVMPETMTSGTISVLVDESVQPIIEDVLAVFSSVYNNAHITQVNSTENEIVNALLRDSITTAVMSRPLTKEEESHFTQQGMTPEVTFFATDALAVITSGKVADTTITVAELTRVLKGETSAKIKKLVLDNPNSGTVHYLMELAGINKLPVNNIIYQKSSVEVINFVSSNPQTVGIVGINWLLQPTPQLKKVVDNLTVLAVDNVKTEKGEKKYYKPNQSNIGAGLYPFTRKLYVLNYQGRKGLGIGFANYIRATQGQLIILKSGLLPQEIPTREIEVRKKL